MVFGYFFFGAAFTALMMVIFGQPATQNKYFPLFWLSLALATVSLLPWSSMFSGMGRHARGRNAPGAQVGQGVGRFLGWLGGVFLSLGSMILSGLRSLAVGIRALAQTFPLWFLAAGLGLLLVYASGKLGEQVDFGTLSAVFLLFHATIAAFLLAGGVLLITLRFLGRNLLVTWLYFGIWAVLFISVKMDDLGFLWYKTPEVWLAVTVLVIGTRIIVGGVTKWEWWTIVAIATAFAGYFLLASKEYDLGYNVGWLVAASFSGLLATIAVILYKKFG